MGAGIHAGAGGTQPTVTDAQLVLGRLKPGPYAGGSVTLDQALAVRSIEQDVARVHHAHSVDELVRLGQDTERQVLARAVRYWAEDRVLLVGDRTVVFA